MTKSRSTEESIVDLIEDQGLRPDLPDDLLILGEREALARQLDRIDLQRLGGHLWVFVAGGVAYLLASVAEGNPLRVAIAGAMILADLGLLRLRRRGMLSTSVRQVSAFVLVAHFLVFQVFHGASDGGVLFWFVVIPLLAVRLRFATGELLTLFGTLLGLFSLRQVVEGMVSEEKDLALELLVGFGVFYALCALTAWLLTKRLAKRFLTRWRVESTRQRERLRMKEELEYARQIQLSMLPREAPGVGWLDIAALSLPATEVGGDYYDYFPLDEHRLALVVGDVTGHGVASGLVLSGVRSGLNLLQDDLVSPKLILGRVNNMLKKTTTRRMLMTLGVAVFDRESCELTVATAGHPPILVRRLETDEVDEIGRGSLPLGAFHDETYCEDKVKLIPGDVALIYSDGLVETERFDGEQFGWVRLKDVLAREVGRVRSAHEVRDAILRSVWEFKGETEQVDDVTMVVVRVVRGERPDDLELLRQGIQAKP